MTNDTKQKKKYTLNFYSFILALNEKEEKREREEKVN